MESKNNTVVWCKAIILAIGLGGLALYFLAASSGEFLGAQIVASEETEPIEKKVKMLVVGDIMLDRKVRRQMQEFGESFPFEKITEYIAMTDSDIVVGNLEGAITHFPSKTIDYANKVLQFTFATTTGELLRAVGFTHLGLANNHTLNFGPVGLEETHQYLEEVNLSWFGDPKNEKEISVVTEVQGIKVGLVGYHAFDYGIERVFDEITRLRPTVDLLFVFPHWGTEYELSPSQGIRSLGHKFIDLGADAVFGAHPHVVQDIEIYKNKPIFYSLGNFIFDQDFSENTKIGLAVTVQFDNNGALFSLQPTALSLGQVSLIPIDDVRSTALLQRIGKDFVSPYGFFSLPFQFSTSTPEASVPKIE